MAADEFEDAAQFFERQCPAHQVRAAEIAIDETVREMFDVKLGPSARVS